MGRQKSFSYSSSSSSDGEHEEGLIFGRTLEGSVLHPDLSEAPSAEINLLLNNSDIEIRVDKRRWLILFVFCTTAWVNSILWITFASISELSVTYYSLSSPFWINFQSLIYFIMYVPGVFLASWVLDHLGLRFGITTGVVLYTIGAAIRVGGYNEYTFFITCIGQTICAIAQPFIQNAPSKVAAQWFPDKQRALATTIGSVANPIGGALGLLIPPVVLKIFEHSKYNITILLFIDAIFAAITLILVVAFFRSRPPFPPSKTALQQQISDAKRLQEKRGLTEFKLAVKTIFSDKDYIILFVVYSLNLGAFQALATLVNQLMSPYGYSPGQSGGMGAMVVIFGVVGAAVAGRLMDKFRAYKLALLISLVSAWYSNLLWTTFLVKENFWVLTLIACSFGFFLVPVLPLTIALTTEVTYPISEATPVGFIVMGGMVWSAVLIIVMSVILSFDYVHVACYTVGLQSAMSYLVFIFFRENLKRTAHEKLMRETETKNSSQSEPGDD